MEENIVTFGTLNKNGSLSNVKQVKQSMFGNCPFFIMDMSHYREDGSCKCNDPEHRKMMKKKWGYTNKSFRDVGITP